VFVEHKCSKINKQHISDMETFKYDMTLLGGRVAQTVRLPSCGGGCYS